MNLRRGDGRDDGAATVGTGEAPADSRGLRVCGTTRRRKDCGGDSVGPVLLGVDVGGTFTDAVLFDGRRVHTAKAPSTPDDQSLGVLAAVDAALERAAAGPAEVRSFAHGMTVGTNALLEERGARTALVATGGSPICSRSAARTARSLYRLCAPKPASAGRRQRPGRRRANASVPRGSSTRSPTTSSRGLWQPSARPAPSRSRSAFCSPTSIQRTSARSQRALRAELPGVHVSASHEVLPQFREYERCSTTVIDAYLSPLLGRYLGRLRTAASRPRTTRAGRDDVLRRGRTRRRGGAGRRLERALGARRRRGRCRAGGAVVRRRQRARLRHGRHLLRRLRGRGRPGTSDRLARDRRPRDPAADGRRAHGRRRRWLDRMARPGRRPTGRAALGRGRAGAGVLRARRRRAHGDRRQPAARQSRSAVRARRRRRARRPGRGGGGRAPRGRARARADRDRGGNRQSRKPGDGPCPAGRHRRARDRPTTFRVDAVRRRRADACGGNRGRARYRAPALPARQRRALGARAAGLRAPPRYRSHRDDRRG